ncbi:hypothetical protein OZX69_06625 [Lactobacillus sp. ESL0731]|uniref:hypothetical protein n=1 Tax=unclassified Lactobacillus TaxID=2620435 RepID=UPI0023F90F89|nr:MULTISPECIES: hypothetical protein [unclassified Lactobacillus]WEV50621.1 hypothetical protein OZX63_06620 [Lactobacillus sp. ESL0700]WEV61751.1 hypothetical protein OZX69_06625 [Lactobacillus sp. ESL0731]
MNKKSSFLIYAVVTGLLIFLARENWTAYLSSKKLWQLSFAWVDKPLIFSLLSANTLLFDYLSIWLPRSNLDSISDLVMIRQPNLRNFVVNVVPYVWQYLLIFVLVHIIAFNSSNIIGSIIMLTIMTFIWLIITFWPNYQHSLSVQGIVIFTLLLGIRLFVNRLV